MGSQDDFEYAREFLDDTGMKTITMVWEGSGHIWRIAKVGTPSALQLASHDLSERSRTFFFNEDGRQIVLDAAPQQPWAP